MESQSKVFGTELAAHIRSVYTANADARSEVTSAIRDAKYAADQQYSPDLVQKVKSSIGGSLTYYPVIRTKYKSAAAWIQKILSTADKPWAIMPTPDPDLDDGTIQEIAETAMLEGQRMASLGLDMTPEDYYDFAQDMRNLIMQQRNTRAADAAAKAEVLIADQMAEGGFDTVLTDFIKDFCLYPAAFFRAKVTQDKVSKVEESSDDSGNPVFTKMEKISEIRSFERLSPVRVFPSAGQVKIDDDDVVVVSLYSLNEIADLADVPGYNRNEIESLLAEYDQLSVDTSRDPLDEFSEAKLYSSDANKYRRSSRLAALEYYGSVKGKLLRDWCLSGNAAKVKEREEAIAAAEEFLTVDPETGRPIKPEDVAGMMESDSDSDNTADGAENSSKCGIPVEELEDDRFYDVFAITIHDRCIYCRITDGEPRWLYSASFETNPDSIWGIGIGGMLAHTQSDINSVRRATMNNLNLASYPQIVYNVDAMAQYAPGGRPSLFPGKMWPVKSTFAGVSKPVDFIQIPSTYQYLNNEFQQLLISADRVSGIPEYSQGMASGAKNGAAGTASGLSMLLEAAGNQIKEPIENLDNGLLEPLIQAMYYELLNDPEVSPDAKGDFKIVALGANGLIFKEQATIRRREFLQLVLSSPVLQQLIKPEGMIALIREVVDGLSMETDDIVPNKAELLEKLAAAEREAQMQMMMQNGGMPPGAGDVQPPPMQEDIPARQLPVQPPQEV